MRKVILPLILILMVQSCQNGSKETKEKAIFESVSAVSDSVVVGDMVIHNTFKHQILAHKDSGFDSLTILNKVYLPNKNTFDNCLGMIFGDENAIKFRPKGLYEWNRKLIRDNKAMIESKLAVLDSVDVNQLFRNHLTAVQEITGQKGKGKWMIYFGPKDFQISGGCDKSTMVLDMFGDAWSTTAINGLFAHEIEHLVFEPTLQDDQHGHTGLGITLDEGLAVYYTYKYLHQDVSEALYGEQNKVLFEREKEIFNALEPYLLKTEEEGCPIYRHCGRSGECEPILQNIPENIEDELCYFLGFRIIESYVKQHGEGSWKDIYRIPLIEFYENSGYKEYIQAIE
ncbi:hypothetical protein [Pontibacter mangrovi]|uniref:DUF2268 domain-containing protein n=1 Tax=Pontibacter mangrovi TaxID=2589816 RepID=A0A501W319_9BACT|nr:hypothetical protein [Pontibacter mangrovi]TPE42484.1 hypothetical protein FJM65_17940 [Pontibacter mangrovi]